MLKITHHSGRSRWLNFSCIEDVEQDDQGQTVITLSSGRQHVASESIEHVIAAVDAWDKTPMPHAAYEPAAKSEERKR